MPGGAPRQNDHLEGIEQDDEQASDARNKRQNSHVFLQGSVHARARFSRYRILTSHAKARTTSLQCNCDQNNSMAGRLHSLSELPPATARWVTVWLAIL